MSVVQAERRLVDFTDEDLDFDIMETLRLSIESLRTGGGSITAPIEYAEAYIYTDQNKVDMVPAAQRDGQSVIVFAEPPSGKHHKRAATPRGDHRSASMRPDQKGKGNAPANPWPKGEGHKEDPYANKGHKGDQSKGQKGDQHKGKGGLYGHQHGQYGRGRSARSRTPAGGHQPGAQAAPVPDPSPMYPAFPMGGFMHDAANVAWRNAAGVVAVSAGESRRIHESKFASHSDLG